MNKAIPPAPELLRRLVSAVSDFHSECLAANRALLKIMAAPDRQMIMPGRAPDTYAEFLFRTAGPLQHEPPASARG